MHITFRMQPDRAWQDTFVELFHGDPAERRVPDASFYPPPYAKRLDWSLAAFIRRRYGRQYSHAIITSPPWDLDDEWIARSFEE